MAIFSKDVSMVYGATMHGIDPELVIGELNKLAAYEQPPVP
jgi:hypothetical protein